MFLWEETGCYFGPGSWMRSIMWFELERDWPREEWAGKSVVWCVILFNKCRLFSIQGSSVAVISVRRRCALVFTWELYIWPAQGAYKIHYAASQEALIPPGVSAGAVFHKVVISPHKGVSNITDPYPGANQGRDQASSKSQNITSSDGLAIATWSYIVWLCVSLTVVLVAL